MRRFLGLGLTAPAALPWRLPPNRWLYASICASAAFLAAAVYRPAAHEPFATVAVPLVPALTAIVLAIGPAAVIELVKAPARRIRWAP
jgi:hypothetical protein